MKKLFLLDAYSLIYRSYYAFIKNPRMNSKGQNTSATFGFILTLEDILTKEKPSHIAVVFDPPGPTFRHEIYKEYKAQRPPTPEDIKLSVPFIKQIIEAYNIPIIEVEGYEADDVIATLAIKAANSGYKVYMMTPDKDYCQIVNDEILLYKPKRSGNDAEILGIKEVNEKFGIENPSQVIDILALMGDSSDNIPGAKGIGEKTAQKLIKEFKSVENLIENTDKLKGSVKTKVENSLNAIKLSKTLVTIVKDIDIAFEEKKYETETPDLTKLFGIFDELEFKTLVPRIKNRVNPSEGKYVQSSLFDMATPDAAKVTEPQYKTIKDTVHEYVTLSDKNDIDHLIENLSNQDIFCFDTETTGLEPHTSDIVGISFSYQTNKGYYLPLPKDENETNETIDYFKPVFENENITKCGQNLKFDILMLKKYDVDVKGKIFDTMLAHYLLNPDQRHNLDYLSETFLQYKPISIESLIGKKGKAQLSMRSVKPEKVAEYAIEDADLAWQLKLIFEKSLSKEELDKLFAEIETPLVPVLAEMEYAGVRIDKKALGEYANELSEKIKNIEQEIINHAGIEFNVASPKQLGEVLFDRMKIIDNPKKTKSKQYSTSEQELSKLKNTHPIISKILEFRSLQKLLNTYVGSLPDLINTKTGKLHTSFNQAVTSTGRLSSANPNLQNIPIRTAEGRKIRESFVPSDDDHVLLAADYSQIELRLMAHLSNDKGMIEAFTRGEDIHAATAAKIYKKTQEEVTREMRSNAKSANFGIIYGISSFGLAQNLNISRTEAKQLIDGYFNSYPDVKTYMDSMIASARKNGHVKTIFGRKRDLKDINSRNSMVRGIAERNAINAPIQGSAADIIKLAMIKIHNEIKCQNFKTKMILQVHDELVFDVLKSELDEIKTLVKNEMENVVDLKVPLIVDMNSGVNWLEAH